MGEPVQQGTILDMYRRPPAERPPAPKAVLPLCLSVRTGSGEYYAFPYGQLVWANFNPSKGLQLHFSSHTVTVEGSRLETLYHEVLGQTLREVVVSPGRAEFRGEPEGDDEKLPIIEKIHVAQVNGQPYGAADFALGDDGAA